MYTHIILLERISSRINMDTNVGTGGLGRRIGLSDHHFLHINFLFCHDTPFQPTCSTRSCEGGLRRTLDPAGLQRTLDPALPDLVPLQTGSMFATSPRPVSPSRRRAQTRNSWPTLNQDSGTTFRRPRFHEPLTTPTAPSTPLQVETWNGWPTLNRDMGPRVGMTPGQCCSTFMHMSDEE